MPPAPRAESMRYGPSWSPGERSGSLIVIYLCWQSTRAGTGWMRRFGRRWTGIGGAGTPPRTGRDPPVTDLNVPAGPPAPYRVVRGGHEGWQGAGRPGPTPGAGGQDGLGHPLPRDGRTLHPARHGTDQPRRAAERAGGGERRGRRREDALGLGLPRQAVADGGPRRVRPLEQGPPELGERLREGLRAADLQRRPPLEYGAPGEGE